MASPSQPDTRRTTRTGVHRGIALPLTGAILLAVGVMSGLAGADTPTTHAARATTATQSNVAPPGPLTGLSDLSPVTIRVTQAGPSDQITGIVAIRQCKPGLAIVNSAELTPSNTGFCLKTPISAGSNNVISNATKASSTDSFIETTFKVGTGTQTYAYDDGSPQSSTITCDATHPCSLWIQIARSGGSDFVHFDLDFGAGGTTTSTTAATTTSTTAGGTTTSTIAGTTTSTTAGGTTTSTTAGGTHDEHHGRWLHHQHDQHDPSQRHHRVAHGDRRRHHRRHLQRMGRRRHGHRHAELDPGRPRHPRGQRGRHDQRDLRGPGQRPGWCPPARALRDGRQRRGPRRSPPA